jgi:hypothetical protein
MISLGDRIHQRILGIEEEFRKHPLPGEALSVVPGPPMPEEAVSYSPQPPSATTFLSKVRSGIDEATAAQRAKE